LIPGTFARHKTVDKYELGFLDAMGKRTSIETYLMRKIVYAQTDD
jgi:hypothetical protein